MLIAVRQRAQVFIASGLIMANCKWQDNCLNCFSQFWNLLFESLFYFYSIVRCWVTLEHLSSHCGPTWIATRVTRCVCGKNAQNVATSIFCQNYYLICTYTTLTVEKSSTILWTTSVIFNKLPKVHKQSPRGLNLYQTGHPDRGRVARFFMTQYTKTGKKIPNYH
jgi:hypothetical protein